MHIADRTKKSKKITANMYIKIGQKTHRKNAKRKEPIIKVATNIHSVISLKSILYTS